MMLLASHWGAACVGQPYAPPEQDCWGFFRRVQAEHFGLLLPEISIDAGDVPAIARAFRDQPERVHWQEVARPVEGDAVLMGRCRVPVHVGTWIDADGGGVLHCERSLGVIFSTPAALRRVGWSLIRYYRRSP